MTNCVALGQRPRLTLLSPYLHNREDSTSVYLVGLCVRIQEGNPVDLEHESSVHTEQTLCKRLCMLGSE